MSEGRVQKIKDSTQLAASLEADFDVVNAKWVWDEMEIKKRYNMVKIILE